VTKDEIRDRSRRKFLVVSSAVIATPALLNLTGPAAAAATAKKPGKVKIYFITSKCIGCHACKIFCPQKAVYFGVRKMEIDQDKCVQCGTCYNECPISVIEEVKL
jgi:ferredoxin